MPDRADNSRAPGEQTHSTQHPLEHHRRHTESWSRKEVDGMESTPCLDTDLTSPAANRVGRQRQAGVGERGKRGECRGGGGGACTVQAHIHTYMHAPFAQVRKDVCLRCAQAPACTQSHACQPSQDSCSRVGARHRTITTVWWLGGRCWGVPGEEGRGDEGDM